MSLLSGAVCRRCDALCSVSRPLCCGSTAAIVAFHTPHKAASLRYSSVQPQRQRGPRSLRRPLTSPDDLKWHPPRAAVYSACWLSPLLGPPLRGSGEIGSASRRARGLSFRLGRPLLWSHNVASIWCGVQTLRRAMQRFEATLLRFNRSNRGVPHPPQGRFAALFIGSTAAPAGSPIATEASDQP